MNPKPLFVFPFKDNDYRVIDGDSVDVIFDRGWKATKGTNQRLLGLNAPEVRTRRSLEKQAGLWVKDLVIKWFADRKETKWFYATSEERPKFFGRTVGRIWAEDPSDCLNDYLLGLGVVKPYEGGKREAFTDEELTHIIEIADREINGNAERRSG
tara:strand:+ start:293 stop:757 length:465 start_codon:yes stop_codon:yes gene_type:complete